MATNPGLTAGARLTLLVMGLWLAVLAGCAAYSAASPLQSVPVYTVNHADDVNDGVCDTAHCSLREAILAANTGGASGVIQFKLPGNGPYIIQPASALPVIGVPVTIDGTTQPGYTGTPLVELDGSQAGALVNGLWLIDGGSTVRGLVIRGFSFSGIQLSGAGDNTIENNYIGTDVTGTLKRGNRDGVYIFNSANNSIGGDNLISGNNDDGVNLTGAGATGNLIHHNVIGLSAAGQPLGNAGDGIKVGSTASQNEISDNIIAANALNGIYLESGTTNPTGIYMARNSLYGNGLLGIDLGGDGVTLNDPGDADTGPNHRQNFPAITRAAATGTHVLLYTTLDAAPNTAYTLHFYYSATCDRSGYGEAEQYLGQASTTTDASGAVTLGITFVKRLLPGTVIMAAATDPDNNTSELSACKRVDVHTLR